MKFGKTLMAAAAASAMMIGTASTASADWDGTYFGTYGGVTFAPFMAALMSASVGFTGGFNLTPGTGNFLVGVRVDAGAMLLAGTFLLNEVMASVRFGGLLSPDVLLYGTVGMGTHYPYISPAMASMIGVGAEIALGGNLSVFGEVRRNNVIPGGVPATAYTSIMLGMNVNK
jgi:hypothetical protein